MCLATQEQIATTVCLLLLAYKYLFSQFLGHLVQARDFIHRTPESHDYHCSLDGALSNEHSTSYGVNFSSALNELNHFHQLPQVSCTSCLTVSYLMNLPLF